MGFFGDLDAGCRPHPLTLLAGWALLPFVVYVEPSRVLVSVFHAPR